MTLSRQIEIAAQHVANGNKLGAQRLVESLLRQYSRKSDQTKIKAILGGASQ